MSDPLVSVVIPTHDRPHLLPDAVASALAQTVGDLEVVVVDDGSEPPVVLPPDPRLRLVRLEPAGGNAAARNAGLAAARGRWVTMLDDDDLLVADHLERALGALAASDLPPPVACLSAVAVVDPAGSVLEVRRPPTMPRGRHFSLEELPAGRSFNAKQTLVVETEVLRALGGWDPSFRSRTATELFLRLNPVCSLLGTDAVTYHLRQHDGPRVSRHPSLRQRSFRQLLDTHAGLFALHPQRRVDLLLEHAGLSLRDGDPAAARWALAEAARRSPRHTARRARTVARVLVRTWRARPAPGAPR